jgi:hypothetical protein
MTLGEDNPSFQVNHIAFDDVDFHGMKLVLEDWSKRGFNGDLNLDSAQRGYVTITTENWVPNHEDPFLSFEVHKLKGKKRLFIQGTNWVARIFTCQSSKGAFPRVHGCMTAPTLIFTMNEVPGHSWNGREFGRGENLEQFYLY